MALFKSQATRRIEREVEVRRGINFIRRNIRDLERNEAEYLQKAKRARQLGSTEQLAFLRQTLKRTAAQCKMMERQLLNIETAIQIKSQAEAHAQFARSMNAVSKTIAEAFGRTDLNATAQDFERAMAKAESLEQQMDVFLEMSSSSMLGYEGTGEELVSDADIDRLIDDEVLADEQGDDLDGLIESGLSDVRQQLRGES